VGDDGNIDETTGEAIDEKAILKAKKKAEKEAQMAFEKREEEERQRRKEEKLRDMVSMSEWQCEMRCSLL
jgi:hypothetical protein